MRSDTQHRVTAAVPPACKPRRGRHELGHLKDSSDEGEAVNKPLKREELDHKRVDECLVLGWWWEHLQVQG